MDPRIAEIVSREMPNAVIIVPPTEQVSASAVKAQHPMLESERLLRQKYGDTALTPIASPNSIQMVVVEYPGGRHETLVLDLSAGTVIATSG